MKTAQCCAAILVAMLSLATSQVRADADCDRHAVAELISRYAWGVDTLERSAFEEVFLPDATAHYIGVGKDAIALDESLQGLDAIHAWLVENLGHRKGHDGLPWHFVSNQIVTLDGDTAKLRAYMHNRVLAAGGVYYVDAVKTDSGWRIQHLRLEEQTWNKDFYRQGPSSKYVE